MFQFGNNNDVDNDQSTGSPVRQHLPDSLQQPMYVPVPVDTRPPVWSYTAILVKTLENSDQKSLRLRDIYSQIEALYPELIAGKRNWKGAIRHNLSASPCFIKVENEGGFKGHFWCLNPDIDFSLVQRQDGYMMVSLARPLSSQKAPVPRYQPYIMRPPPTRPIHRGGGGQSASLHSIPPLQTVPFPRPQQQFTTMHAPRPHAQQHCCSCQCLSAEQHQRNHQQHQSAMFPNLSNGM